jgi:spore coat polysaccharide biosynthesis predicted glycosyltransferase SpsG
MLFAANGTPEVGAGHVMRCIQYAKLFQNLGYSIEFFGEISIPWLVDLFLESFSCSTTLPVAFFDCVLIDSYDPVFVERIIKFSQKNLIVQVADSNSPIFDVDLLIWLDPYSLDHSLHSKAKKILWGPKYMPVERLGHSDSREGVAKNVLLVAGGAPLKNHVELCIDAIKDSRYDDVIFHIFANDLQGSASQSNLRYYQLGRSVEAVGSLCDTVISASGTAVWNYLANHKSVGVIKSVENQSSNYRFVTSQHLAIGLGDLTSETQLNKSLLFDLLKNTSVRNNLHKDVSSHVDFLGAERVVRAIQNLL